MPNVLEWGEDRISFGLDGLTPSVIHMPVVSGAVENRMYFGAEPLHASLLWPGRRRKAWIDDVALQIARLSTLPPGWDGHRARPIDHRLLVQVWRALERLSEFVRVPPAVVPTVSGGVALEWHRDDIDLEIEWRQGQPMFVSFEDAAGTEAEGPLGEYIDVVADALSRLR